MEPVAVVSRGWPAAIELTQQALAAEDDEEYMKFVEELNQLITKHLGPKANLFDYSEAVEALLEAGHRLDEEAVGAPPLRPASRMGTG